VLLGDADGDRRGDHDLVVGGRFGGVGDGLCSQ